MASAKQKKARAKAIRLGQKAATARNRSGAKATGIATKRSAAAGGSGGSGGG